jgi:hypothetical protein
MKSAHTFEKGDTQILTIKEKREEAVQYRISLNEKYRTFLHY